MGDVKPKFEEWREWLFGEDTHSIQRQILNMIWDAAVFRTINEARNYSEIDENGEPQLNNMVHRFINHSFFQMQAIAIRRLLDGRKDVVSIGRLINDIQRNCHLLTRRTLLDVLGYPYEYEKDLASCYRAAVKGKPRPDILVYKHSQSIHKNIDSLAGVQSDQRSPDDSVRAELVAWLKRRLEGCWEIGNYVNKFVAHAATPESRAKINADELKITLGKLLDAHKIICEIAQLIGLRLLYHSYGNFLVVPQYDQFEHFEKPWVSESALPELNDYWQGYYKETMSWKDWDWQAGFNESTEK